MAHRQVIRYVRKQGSGRTTYKQYERLMQRQATKWLNSKGVVFFNDWASGAYLTQGQNMARTMLACDYDWVDTLLAEPQRGYHGAFYELKREGTSVYLKDGVTLRKDPQIQKEGAFLQMMRDKGYRAEFIIGIDHFKREVSWYMGWEYLEQPELF